MSAAASSVVPEPLAGGGIWAAPPSRVDHRRDFAGSTLTVEVGADLVPGLGA